MRVSARVSLGLALAVSAVGSAWAQAARAPRDSPPTSDRMLRADERSRAATTAICQGCTTQLGTGRERRTRVIWPKPLAREARRLRRVPLSNPWIALETLPVTSRAEAQIQESNRMIAVEQQLRHVQQQTQFELNQLRTEIQRNYLFPLVTLR